MCFKIFKINAECISPQCLRQSIAAASHINKLPNGPISRHPKTYELCSCCFIFNYNTNYLLLLKYFIRQYKKD